MTRRALAAAALLGLLAGCSSADPQAADPTAGSDPAPSPSSSPAPQSPGAPGADAGPAAPTPDSGAKRPDAGGPSAPDASSPPSIPVPPGWRLTWNDEFDLPDGSPIDPAKWNQETGGNGWSTNLERQYYTGGTENAVVRGGALVITAKTQGASAYSCGYGTCEYTSARFNTSGKFAQAYGRFEARVQVPRGQGMWPAWWVLGGNIGSVGWPRCGEIDIMENIGREPATNHGSLHGPGYSGGNPLTAATSLASGALADAFHRFTIEWEPNVVRFYLDDNLYETRTPADVPAGDQWVYDHPFFLILNLAVGGRMPGDPDGTTQFPQEMKVDYVRVFSR